jgi:hypothetical protein
MPRPGNPSDHRQMATPSDLIVLAHKLREHGDGA